MAQPPSSLGKLDPDSKFHKVRPLPFAAKKLSISILVISLPLLYLSVLHIPPSTIFKDTTFWFLMSNSIIILVAADSGVFSSPHNSADDLYDEFVKHSRARIAVSTLEVGDHKENEEGDSKVAVDKSIVVLEKLAVQKPIPVCNTAHEKQRSEREAAVDSSKSSLEKPAMEKPIMPIEESASMKQRTLLSGARMPKQEKKSLFRHQKSLGNGRRNAMEAKPLRRSVTEKGEGLKTEEENEYAKMSDEELNKRVEEFIKRVNKEIRLQLQD